MCDSDIELVSGRVMRVFEALALACYNIRFSFLWFGGGSGGGGSRQRQKSWRGEGEGVARKREII